jgi:hypothetical protein
MNLFCLIFRHREIRLEPKHGIASPRQCARCGHYTSGANWSKHDNSDLIALLEEATLKANTASTKLLTTQDFKMSNIKYINEALVTFEQSPVLYFGRDESIKDDMFIYELEDIIGATAYSQVALIVREAIKYQSERAEPIAEQPTVVSLLDTSRMRSCTPLLPEPGDQVVIQCLDEIERLLEILNSLDANEIARVTALRSGRNPDGSLIPSEPFVQAD